MAENELGENLIFVCGCGHSGTTLLWAMLSAHSRVHGIPYETDVFINSRRKHSPFLTGTRKAIVFSCFNILSSSGKRRFKSFSRTGYLSFSRTDTDILSFFNEQLDYASSINKDIICEKTPRHILKIDRIKKIFPKSHIIALVRNGLDVTASLKERRGNFKNAMDRWINDNKTMLFFRNTYPVHLVKYEDLITSPERELRKICNYCNLEFEDGMLSYHKASSSSKWDYEVRKQQVIQPIIDRRNRWKETLTKSEFLMFTEKADELMKYFGYETNL